MSTGPRGITKESRAERPPTSPSMTRAPGGRSVPSATKKPKPRTMTAWHGACFTWDRRCLPACLLPVPLLSFASSLLKCGFASSLSLSSWQPAPASFAGVPHRSCLCLPSVIRCARYGCAEADRELPGLLQRICTALQFGLSSASWLPMVRPPPKEQWSTE